jgi:sterol desaturase/sphingolipid hydroxylase (fatty acid hydroxylase superfamily)
MNPGTLRTLLGEDLPPDQRAGLLVALTVLLMLMLGLALVEGWALSRRGSYDWRAFAATLGDVLGRRVVDAVGLSVAAPVLVWAWSHRLSTVPLNHWQAFVLLFLGQELCYYGYHRAAHRVRWFWASHAVHHSPNELTLAGALRLGWTGKLTGTALFFVPLVWLGFSPQVALGCVALNLLYQFWLHTTWIPRLWWPLEAIFNTPSHHRVHHASNPEYLDCNFGGVLIVFDRLFGTCVDERADVPIRYGLSTPLHSFNPVHIALHEWLQLGRALRQAPGWRERLSVVCGPPPGPPGQLVARPSAPTRGGHSGSSG